MAKKGNKNHGSKKSRKSRPKVVPRKDPDEVSIEGDLRTVDLHVKAFLEGQVDEATGALMAMGRDASYPVQTASEGSDNADLKELARRLAAVPPQVDTNLNALREASVWAHVEQALDDAPLAASAELHVTGGAVALFDPTRVLEALAKNGRPRRDEERIQRGDIAPLGLPDTGAVTVRFSTKPPPDLALGARLRLRVSSGVVFVGPPEASDGPRMGTVRIDPFTTGLDEYLSRGSFVLVKPGTYALYGLWQSEAGLRVHIVPDPDPKARIALDAGGLAHTPSVVDR